MKTKSRSGAIFILLLLICYGVMLFKYFWVTLAITVIFVLIIVAIAYSIKESDKPNKAGS